MDFETPGSRDARNREDDAFLRLRDYEATRLRGYGATGCGFLRMITTWVLYLKLKTPLCGLSGGSEYSGEWHWGDHVATR
jgi:hypothetical protein